MSELDDRFAELDRRISIAESRWSNLTISGPGWAGDSEHGFIFNPEPIRVPASSPASINLVPLFDVAFVRAGNLGYQPSEDSGNFYSYLKQDYCAGGPPSTSGTTTDKWRLWMYRKLQVTGCDSGNVEFDDGTLTEIWTTTHASFVGAMVLNNTTEAVNTGGAPPVGGEDIISEFFRSTEYTSSQLQSNVPLHVPDFDGTWDAFDPSFHTVQPTWPNPGPNPIFNIAFTAAFKHFYDFHELYPSIGEQPYLAIIAQMRYKFTIMPQAGQTRITWLEGSTFKTEIIPSGSSEGIIHVIPVPGAWRNFTGYHTGTGTWDSVTGPDPITIYNWEATIV